LLLGAGALGGEWAEMRMGRNKNGERASEEQIVSSWFRLVLGVGWARNGLTN